MLSIPTGMRRWSRLLSSGHLQVSRSKALLSLSVMLRSSSNWFISTYSPSYSSVLCWTLQLVSAELSWRASFASLWPLGLYNYAWDWSCMLALCCWQVYLICPCRDIQAEHAQGICEDSGGESLPLCNFGRTKHPSGGLQTLLHGSTGFYIFRCSGINSHQIVADWRCCISACLQPQFSCAKDS